MDQVALNLSDTRDSLKTISLKAEKIRLLAVLGIPTHPSYLITPLAFNAFTAKDNLLNKLTVQLRNTNFHDPHDCARVSDSARKLIKSSSYPQKLVGLLTQMHQKVIGNDAFSVTLDPATGFKPIIPGVLKSYRGSAVLLKTIRDVWALQFSPKAIATWNQNPILPVPSIIISKLSDTEVCGEIYTHHPLSYRKDHILIRAWRGVLPIDAEIPDHYTVNHKTQNVVTKQIVKQYFEYKFDRHGGIKKSATKAKLRALPKLTLSQIQTATNLAVTLHHQLLSPQHIKFNVVAGHIFISEYEPQADSNFATVDPDIPSKSSKLPLVGQGLAASPGIVTAPLRLITSKNELKYVNSGEVVVIGNLFPELLSVMKKITALVTELGGVTTHAALLARELGIPSVVAVPKITKLVKSGDVVTVDGNQGKIYKGGYKASPIRSVTTSSQPVSPLGTTTATKVLVAASSANALNTITGEIDGIGLIRGDLLLAQFGVHPQRILSDSTLKRKFSEFINENLDPLMSQLPQKSVNYRLSNLYSDQYRQLQGGHHEAIEANPILGLHGATRFIHDPAFFHFEFTLVQKLFEKHGLNGTITFPCVRTLAEYQYLKRHLVSKGIRRTAQKHLAISVETPAMIHSLEKLNENDVDACLFNTDLITLHFWGFDLTNPEVNRYLNYFDESLLKLIAQGIYHLSQKNIHSYVHGSMVDGRFEAYQSFVQAGITGIVVSPSLVTSTREYLTHVELKRIAK